MSTDEHTEHTELLARIQEGMNYINQFKNTYAGIIALNGGFSLDAARKAGLLKE